MTEGLFAFATQTLSNAFTYAFSDQRCVIPEFGELVSMQETVACAFVWFTALSELGIGLRKLHPRSIGLIM